MTMETWRPISVDPRYSISDIGRVRKEKSGKIKATLTDRYGYTKVVLYDSAWKGKKYSVARLVLQAFAGDPPEGGMHAAHLSGEKSNNTFQNLVWATAAENESHKIAHGTAHVAENHPAAKLNWDKVRQIRRRFQDGESKKGLARSFDISSRSVQFIVNNVHWRDEEYGKEIVNG